MRLRHRTPASRGAIGIALCAGMVALASAQTAQTALAGPTQPASSSPNATPAPSPKLLANDLSGKPDCAEPLAQNPVTALRPDGIEQAPVANDELARRFHYTLDGSDITVTIPPPAWRPLTGSDQELEMYGFPPRPKDAAGLSNWQDAYGKWKSRQVGPMCKTGLTATRASSNWGGGVSINSSYTAAVMRWYQTGFDYACPGSSGYVTWSGLGGVNSNRLMQAGTAASSVTLNGIYAWFEVINDSYDSHIVDIGDVGFNPGDYIQATTSYRGSAVDFEVYDLTTGADYAASGSVFNGQPASAFYDGSTADWITERPSPGPADGYLYLRKPHLNSTYIPYAAPNFTDLKFFPSDGIDTVSRAGALLQGQDFDGVHSWSDVWYACG